MGRYGAKAAVRTSPGQRVALVKELTGGHDMGLIGWLILGALAGWLASLINKTNREQGWIGNIVLGVIGALVGGCVRRLDREPHGLLADDVVPELGDGFLASVALAVGVERRDSDRVLDHGVVGEQ